MPRSKRMTAIFGEGYRTRQNKWENPELVRRTTSTSTFTLRTVTQGVRMLEMETNRITRKLMDAFALQNCHA